MDPINHNSDVEPWLSSALIEYANAEPRAGLEDRILANLQAQRRRITQRQRWWWAEAGAVATAAVIALSVWLGQNNRAQTPGGPSIAARPSAGAEPRPLLSPDVPSRGCAVTRLFPVQPRRRSSARHPAAEPRAVDSKLDKFPAPAPLSDQEELLARYVEEFPQRAALIARAQTELQQRTELEMAAPWPINADLNHHEQQQ